MNGEYIRKSSLDRLLEAVDSFNAVTDFPLKSAPRETLRELLAMYQERMLTLAEMAENSRFFFQEPLIDPKALDKFVKNNNGIAFLKESQALLSAVTDWSKTALAAPLEKILELGTAEGAGGGNAAPPPNPSASPSPAVPSLRPSSKPSPSSAAKKPSPASPPSSHR